MEIKKDMKLIELSKREVEEIIIESKYLKAIDKFNFNITEDIRTILNKININKSYIGLLYKKFVLLDQDLDKYSMQAKQTLFKGFFQDVVNRNINDLIKCKKILTSYYKYLDYGLITPIEDIYKKALSIVENSKHIKDIYDISAHLVLNTDVLSKYNINISKNNFKQLKDCLEYKIPRYKLESLITESAYKIKLNTVLEKYINLEKLNGRQHDDLINYLTLNKNELIDAFKIYHTMIERVGVAEALNYIDENIRPFIIKRLNLKDSSIHSGSNGTINVLDFIEKSCNLSENTYNLKVCDSSAVKYDLIDAAMTFGKDILPNEVWIHANSMIEFYNENSDAIYDGEFSEEAMEEQVQLFDDFIVEMNYIDMEVAKMNDYDSPFLKEGYFKDDGTIGDLHVLDDMETYGFKIGFICTHSKKIDSFIKNNIINNDALNELLMNTEELFSIYCDSCYTISTPKIITRESSIFLKDITSEYLVISAVFYNEITDDTLYKRDLSKKYMSATDYNTIKSILDTNEKLKETILQKRS